MLPAIDKQIMNSTRRASGEGAGSGMGRPSFLFFYWWIGGYKDGGLGRDSGVFRKTGQNEKRNLLRHMEGSPPQGRSGTLNPEWMRREKNRQILRVIEPRKG
jgi:hypothetical protein